MEIVVVSPRLEDMLSAFTWDQLVEMLVQLLQPGGEETFKGNDHTGPVLEGDYYKPLGSLEGDPPRPPKGGVVR